MAGRPALANATARQTPRARALRGRFRSVREHRPAHRAADAEAQQDRRPLSAQRRLRRGQDPLRTGADGVSILFAVDSDAALSRPTCASLPALRGKRLIAGLFPRVGKSKLTAYPYCGSVRRITAKGGTALSEAKKQNYLHGAAIMVGTTVIVKIAAFFL